jgi:hypothetical protein
MKQEETGPGDTPTPAAYIRDATGGPGGSEQSSGGPDIADSTAYTFQVTSSDRETVRAHFEGPSLSSALWRVSQGLRDLQKYYEISDEVHRKIQEIRNDIPEL